MAEEEKKQKIKRDCWLPKVRVTAAELDQIKHHAENSELLFSDYVRFMLMYGENVSRQTEQEDKLIMALSRIGNNVNQLARKAHIREGFSTDQNERLDDLLETIGDYIEELRHGSKRQ